MKPEDCKSFEKCSAPICPLMEHIEKAIFYPHEEICSNRLHNKIKWIKNQRKVSRKNKSLDTGYFTLQTLTKLKATRKQLKGIDPDKKSMKRAIEFEITSPALPLTMARKGLNDGLRRYQEQKRKNKVIK